ncbi:IS1/IS1595 family N-terminal zinc-binding domain-containing protein [Clostridium lundense]|uniref:IS1/IS1595 family N-terminal zinc-binding domain-containing protein n=1 Tax=Clostridium lundense TaxID=319475 RepID=UPI0006845D2B|nr:hypothetical protein [Clostridium lundense]
MINEILVLLMKEVKNLNEQRQNRLHTYFQKILGTSCISDIDILKEMEVKSTSERQCPHCKSTNIVKNGKYDNKQRYICKDCKKSFSDYTKSIISYTKKSIKQWVQYLKCMVLGYSLRESAAIVHLNLSTSFFWRHRILDAIRSFIGNCFLDKIAENHRALSHFLNEVECNKFNNCIISQKSLNNLSNTYDGNAKNKKYYVSKINNIISNLNYKDRFHNKKIEAKVIRKNLYNTYISYTNSNKSFRNRLRSWLKRFNGVDHKYFHNYLYWLKWIIDIFKNKDLLLCFIC